MSWERLSGLAAVSVAACIVSSVAADPPCFRGLGFQLEYGREVTVTGMSADGTTVVGYIHNQDGGWRWVAPNGFQSCPGTPGGLWAALGISGDGLSIVGSMVYDYPTSRRPMRWTAGVGGMWLTALPDSPEGQANAVSGDGLTIVGHVYSSGTYSAFRWDPIGGIQSLGTLPGGDLSQAWGVSADGSVIAGVSTYDDAVNAQGFRWTTETGMVGLGFLPNGGPSSYAYAISADATTIVGIATGAEFPDEAFRWTEAGGMASLGCLPSGDFSRAFAVSADGSVIVGNAGSDCPGGQEAFVWDADHGMRGVRDILENDYGFDLGEWLFLRAARAVSADGTIVAGEGRYADDHWDAWVARIVPVTGTCPGDLDYDGDVDLTDLSLLLAAYGEGSAADLDCDCQTDLSDLSILLANYGTTCE